MQKAFLPWGHQCRAKNTGVGVRQAWLWIPGLLWALLSIAEPQVASSVKWGSHLPYRMAVIIEMMQIKCLHRYPVSINSLNKHLFRTYSFRRCARWWWYQPKQNITKQKEKRPGSWCIWEEKRNIQKERICPEGFADNMLECLLFPRAMASWMLYTG